jgi:hypothetical protein
VIGARGSKRSSHQKLIPVLLLLLNLTTSTNVPLLAVTLLTPQMLPYQFGKSGPALYNVGALLNHGRYRIERKLNSMSA